MDIAFLGIGLMGRPMAERLICAGHRLFLFNRTKDKALALEQQGAVVADSAAEAIARASCVILMLTDYQAIIETLFAQKDMDLAGKTVIQMGTILPSESCELQERVQGRRGEYCECPVLGSRDKAAEGKLIVMVGSSPLQFEQFMPIFNLFSLQPKYIGEVGKAAALKLAMNELIIALIASFSLSYGIVEKAGVAIDDFMDILRSSALYAPTFDKKLPRMQTHDFSDPNFPVKHMVKDVGLILDQSKAQGLDVRLLQSIQALLYKVSDMGFADQDYSAIFEAVYQPGAKDETLS